MNYNAACEVKNLTSPSLEFVPSVLRRWLMHDSNSVRPVQPYSIDGTGGNFRLDCGTRDFGHHSITISLCHTIFYNKISERSSCSRPARLRTRTTTSSPPRNQYYPVNFACKLILNIKNPLIHLLPSFSGEYVILVHKQGTINN